MGSSAANVAYAQKCKDVEQLQAELSAAYAAIDATGLITPPRTTKLRRGKAKGSDLIKKVEELANKLKKQTEERDNLLKEIGLERKDNVDMLRQTSASIDQNIAEATRRGKQEALDQLAHEMSQMEAEIRQLTSQLQVAQ